MLMIGKAVKLAVVAAAVAGLAVAASGALDGSGGHPVASPSASHLAPTLGPRQTCRYLAAAPKSTVFAVPDMAALDYTLSHLGGTQNDRALRTVIVQVRGGIAKDDTSAVSVFQIARAFCNLSGVPLPSYKRHSRSEVM